VTSRRAQVWDVIFLFWLWVWRASDSAARYAHVAVGLEGWLHWWRCSQIKSIGVPFCHPMAKGISIGRSFCHILCHIAILRAKCAQDSQKDSYSHPLCQRRGPIERRATASLERARSELFWLPYHRPSVRGLRTIQGHHLYWKVLCESSERYGPSEGGEQLDLHI